MLKINYKGYEISQASNNHVVICKDKQMLFHSQCNKKLDEEELKKQLEFYLKLNCLNLIEENKQLKDNWNKLKEYIKETKLKEFEKSYGKRYGKTFTQAEVIVCNMISDKMKELEGSDSNEQ